MVREVKGLEKLEDSQKHNLSFPEIKALRGLMLFNIVHR